MRTFPLTSALPLIHTYKIVQIMNKYLFIDIIKMCPNQNKLLNICCTFHLEYNYTYCLNKFTCLYLII